MKKMLLTCIMVITSLLMNSQNPKTYYPKHYNVVGITSTGTVKLTGTIPPNARVRIVPTGTATVSWRSGKEKY